MTTDYEVQEVYTCAIIHILEVLILHRFCQVSEDTVLHDSSGLHYGAGPYMLFYSRALPLGSDISVEWPEAIKVRKAIRHFVMMG
jgi:hypothetical protein